MCLRAPRQLRRRAIVHFYEIGGTCFILAQKQKTLSGRWKVIHGLGGRRMGVSEKSGGGLLHSKLPKTQVADLIAWPGKRRRGISGEKRSFGSITQIPPSQAPDGAGGDWREKCIPSSRIRLRHRVALLELVRARENKLNGFRQLESRCGKVMLK